MSEQSGQNKFAAELNLFWLALGFFTRIPIPGSVSFSQQQLNHASRYFALVGLLIGALTALVFFTVASFSSLPVALVISMGFGFLLTGGFHEDGLADTADGFGGGWTQQQKLSIMKDSRIGSYGSLALWFVLTLKFLLLLDISFIRAHTNITDTTILVMIALIAAHTLSRTLATLVMGYLPYVSDSEQAKSKPLAEHNSRKDRNISVFTGFIAIALIAGCFSLLHALIVLVALVIFLGLMVKLIKKQIGGFTGDTLGASQQLSELTVYLAVLSAGALL
jgi:adenosylcobinamide-GDP ribazoletransferase